MRARPTLPVRVHDVIVVGSGIAGLITALALVPRPVTLITKTRGLSGGSSFWAKGGIAAALGPGDAPEQHAADTVSAANDIGEPELALRLARDGIDDLRWLIDEGIPFDRAQDGTIALAREAAHRHPRIVHAGGDATGQVLIDALAGRVHRTPSITVLRNSVACDFVVRDGLVQGLVGFSPAGGWTYHQSSTIVLATGGIGMTWWHTSNPRESTGDGLAMAARAGAELADLEFMQFHPTALAAGGDDAGASLPLLTEALRGAGALLIDDSGGRFLVAEHADAELAPRDVVARTIERRIHAGQRIYLDLRPVLGKGGGAIFPQAIAASRKAGLDPTRQPLPVTPAAHYHMGGIRIDDRGRSSLSGLWACGEVASTGIHGANRLASNSLLEALVYARRVAADIADHPARDASAPLPVAQTPRVSPEGTKRKLRAIAEQTRRLMSRHVGVLRSGNGLEKAAEELQALAARFEDLGTATRPGNQPGHDTVVLWIETRNVLLVARLVTLGALRRTESRGAHYRDDFPEPKVEWQRHQPLTIESLDPELRPSADTLAPA
jgi:L-aspartate oxidase